MFCQTIIVSILDCCMVSKAGRLQIKLIYWLIDLLDIEKNNKLTGIMCMNCECSSCPESCMSYKCSSWPESCMNCKRSSCPVSCMNCKCSSWPESWMSYKCISLPKMCLSWCSSYTGTTIESSPVPLNCLRTRNSYPETNSPSSATQCSEILTGNWEGSFVSCLSVLTSSLSLSWLVA